MLKKKGLQCILNKRSDIKALIVLMKGLNEWKKMIHAKHDADWEINSLHETINHLICYHMTGNLIGTKGIKSQLSEKYRIKLLKFFLKSFIFWKTTKSIDQGFHTNSEQPLAIMNAITLHTNYIHQYNYDIIKSISISIHKIPVNLLNIKWWLI